MKKKILIFISVFAFAVSLFALAVSAAEIPEWTEITEVSGMPDKNVFGADGTVGATSRVLMSDGVTYPAYYICNDSDSLGFNYSNLNKNTGKSYTAKDVVRLEVPIGTLKSPMSVLKTESGYTSLKTVSFPEGFTTLGSYTFKATAEIPSALVQVSLPSTLTTMGQSEFIDCAALEELIIPDGIEIIPKNLARNATSLKKVILPASLKSIEDTAFRYAGISGEIIIPEGCTTIKQYAFANTNVQKVVIPSTLETLGTYIFTECHSLVEVHSKSTVIGSQMFYKCENVATVVLENTVTIKKQAFNNPDNGTTQIDALVLPEGLTTIEDYAFTRSQITELVIPSTLSTIGQSVFQGSKQLTKVTALNSCFGVNMFQDCSALNTLVLTERFQTFGKSCMGSVSSTSFTIYYTGTDYDRICTLGSAVSDRFNPNKPSTGKGTSYCSYAEYLSGEYRSYKYMFIYDINLCVAAFEGVHTEPSDDGDCTTAVICSMCNEHTFKEAKAHVVGERFTYASFTEIGEYYCGCINDGCENGTAEQRDALFTYLGYSVPEDGNGGVDFGSKVNLADLAEYERVNGVTLIYGVFAVLKDTLGTNDIFDESGKASKGVVSADFASTDFSLFKIKIIGFTDEQKETGFAMGAYVCVDNGGAREYTYMQHQAPTDGEKYYFATYNQIFGASDEE